jgi:DNA invertase Pin-like site-specific DNA recombinase
MSDSNPTQGLRFGPLIRVSTEQQEKQGESLRTQRKQAEEDVSSLGGTIAGWYGGQEHATPGYEKKEVDRLVGDAARGVFDAVIVTNADRWSRDNAKSTQGLDTLRRNGIRFFVRTFEYDLFNPEHRLLLGMSAVIGQFQAHHQTKKSLDNRISRARRGLPASGKLPFGRTFDPKTGLWGIDEQKKAMIEDVARRYLAGEPLPKLAAEHGVNHANLHKVLTRRCGDRWEQKFDSDDLNIHERVEIAVPRLLPEETIQAIRRKAEANKTYYHGQAKHPYLFGRMVFCAHCGYAMFGQCNKNGHRYYRHAHARREQECQRPRAWVSADDLEDAVIRDLFSTFGNPAAVLRAMEEALPNPGKIQEYRECKERIEAELLKVAAARDTFLRLITKGTITGAQADNELGELRQKDERLTAELARLDAGLENVPTKEQLQAVAERVAAAVSGRRRTNARLCARTSEINTDFAGMAWEEKRSLAEMVFGGKTPDGKRMGIYIQWADGQESRRRKTWLYRVLGRLIDEPGLAPKPPFESDDPEHAEFRGGPMQKWLLEESVTKPAMYSPGTDRPARRCGGRTPPPGA